MLAGGMVCLRTLGANIPYQGIKLNWMPVFASSFKSFGARLFKVVAKVEMNKKKEDGILRNHRNFSLYKDLMNKSLSAILSN
jgi:hypothetical protein